MFPTLLTILQKSKQDLASAQTDFKTLAPSSDESLPIAALTVWLKAKIQIDLVDADNAILQQIEENWRQPMLNLFGEPAQCYTSNLALYYATLQEAKNQTGQLALQKTMTAIRDYVFDEHIKGDHSIGANNSFGPVKEGSLIGFSGGEATFDELLAVIPFGLFAPEDLIVVAAVQKLRKQASPTNAIDSLLLGLYYSEKFELETALEYLQQAQQAEQNEVALTLIALLQEEINSKNGVNDVAFLHKPLGNGNVYETLPIERVPHYPQLETKCVLNVQIVGSDIAPVLIFPDLSLEIQGQLLDAKAQIYQFTVVASMAMSQQPYYFELDGQYRSTNYHFEIEVRHSILAVSFVGANEQANVYQCEMDNGAQLYLLGKEQGISFSPTLPAINEQTELTNLWCYQDYLLSCAGQKLSLSKEQPFSVASILGKGIYRFTFNLLDDPQTNYYGFGERYNAINQRGNILDCFVYNQYRDQGTRTYLPMPYYVTDRGYGLFIDTNYYTQFDLQNHELGVVSVTIETDPNDFDFEIQILTGSVKKMVQQFSKYFGQPKMVPIWALGPWMSSNNWDRESVVRAEVTTTNELEIPATVIVLEQWSDETTYYMWNDATYPTDRAPLPVDAAALDFPEWGRWPNPQKLIQDCHANGLKFILWQVPIHKYLNQVNDPLKDNDETYMLSQGYAVKNADGTAYRIPENWYTDSLLLDFTNPAAKKWWFGKRQYLIDMGVDGFKTDGGEMVFGAQARFADGSTGRKMRNQYPAEYIAAYYEFVQQNNGMTFSRSGYLGAGQFPAHWAGDERSTFDAFQRSLKAGINSGLSGVIFWGWDLAGFNGDIPSAELFMRATAMATFCPIMQYHAESKGEFNQDRTPWNIAERTGDAKVIPTYRYFANLRMNLLPYIAWQAQLACESGLPLMQALKLTYPTDSRYDDMCDEYLFGDSLLVAPIIVESATSRNVILPAGKWVDFWTHEVLTGATEIAVTVPIDRIPVYIRENSVIPLNVNQDTPELGSSVGNDITKYQQQKFIVVASSAFKTTIIDHLKNVIEVNVNYENGEPTVQIIGGNENRVVEIISI
ncbi:MAG: glycosyl hydrolase [Lactobacillaceae bacterium]|nr:glycosyl hydrolase [Lactobacillaceae bacterium]